MFQVGQEKTIKKEITEELINDFAKVSTDYNPIHLDEKYAKQTIFGKRIAHGMIAASFISAVIGNDFPGNGTIYMGQTLKFLAPVFIGETLSIVVRIIEITDNKAILLTDVYNTQGEKKVAGEAKVVLPKQE